MNMKQKYVLFDKNGLYWEMVYCTIDNKEDPMEEIAKSMFQGNEFAKFDASKYVCINSGRIKNDENLFILNDAGAQYIWQLGSKVSDMVGAIIPHLYYVRKIGVLI